MRAAGILEPPRRPFLSLTPFKRRASGLAQELQCYYRYRQEPLNHSKNTLQSGRQGPIARCPGRLPDLDRLARLLVEQSPRAAPTSSIPPLPSVTFITHRYASGSHSNVTPLKQRWRDTKRDGVLDSKNIVLMSRLRGTAPGCRASCVFTLRRGHRNYFILFEKGVKIWCWLILSLVRI